LVYPFSGLEAYFFFVYVPFVGRNYGREWKIISPPFSEKPMYTGVSRDFMEVEEKLHLFFFAMMLAGVCALSSLMEGVPYSRGRHSFHLGNDIEVGQTQSEYKKNERIKEIRPYVH